MLVYQRAIHPKSHLGDVLCGSICFFVRNHTELRVGGTQDSQDNEKSWHLCYVEKSLVAGELPVQTAHSLK